MCLDSLFYSSNSYASILDVGVCTCNLHFGILILKKTLCLTPHSWFHLINTHVASSSLTNTSKKFVEANGLLPFFSQCLSFVCPMPEQKKHFRLQLFVLCPPPHLAHLRFKLMNLWHADAICSFDLQSWHWMMLVIPRLGPFLPFVPCPKYLTRISLSICNYLSILVSPNANSYSHSSYRGSYGVFPISPNIFSTSTIDNKSSSMF